MLNLQNFIQTLSLTPEEQAKLLAYLNQKSKPQLRPSTPVKWSDIRGIASGRHLLMGEQKLRFDNSVAHIHSH